MNDSSSRLGSFGLSILGVVMAGMLLSFSAHAGYGGHYFRSLRIDQTIPEKCLDLELNHFEEDEINYFTYSIEGGKRRGFDHEYPLDRGDAKDLWRYIKKHMMGKRVDVNVGDFRKNPSLKRDYLILLANYEAMGFDFGSEGEVLELLVIKELHKSLHEDLYVYGSVQYSDNIAGELDLIIAKKSNCSVIGIGEAKLGIKSLGKAKKQLSRFHGFLRSHLRKGFQALSIVGPLW
ncbi:MAG: hypothetical protein HRT45_05955 [Bdellovibrionales bacterium]|nr:hypothetical protein [Bdellovibrionales bacterium]